MLLQVSVEEETVLYCALSCPGTAGQSHGYFRWLNPDTSHHVEVKLTCGSRGSQTTSKPQRQAAWQTSAKPQTAHHHKLTTTRIKSKAGHNQARPHPWQTTSKTHGRPHPRRKADHIQDTRQTTSKADNNTNIKEGRKANAFKIVNQPSYIQQPTPPST